MSLRPPTKFFSDSVRWCFFLQKLKICIQSYLSITHFLTSVFYIWLVSFVFLPCLERSVPPWDGSDTGWRFLLVSSGLGFYVDIWPPQNCVPEGMKRFRFTVSKTCPHRQFHKQLYTVGLKYHLYHGLNCLMFGDRALQSQFCPCICLPVPAPATFFHRLIQPPPRMCSHPHFPPQSGAEVFGVESPRPVSLHSHTSVHTRKHITLWVLGNVVDPLPFPPW